jgi:hypothetical protein
MRYGEATRIERTMADVKIAMCRTRLSYRNMLHSPNTCIVHAQH